MGKRKPIRGKLQREDFREKVGEGERSEVAD